MGIVNVPTKIVKPRRFDIVLEIRGVTSQRIQFEASSDEAGIRNFFEPSPRRGPPAPRLTAQSELVGSSSEPKLRTSHWPSTKCIRIGKTCRGACGSQMPSSSVEVSCT